MGTEGKGEEGNKGWERRAKEGKAKERKKKGLIEGIEVRSGLELIELVAICECPTARTDH